MKSKLIDSDVIFKKGNQVRRRQQKRTIGPNVPHRAAINPQLFTEAEAEFIPCGYSMARYAPQMVSKVQSPLKYY